MKIGLESKLHTKESLKYNAVWENVGKDKSVKSACIFEQLSRNKIVISCCAVLLQVMLPVAQSGDELVRRSGTAPSERGRRRTVRDETAGRRSARPAGRPWDRLHGGNRHAQRDVASAAGLRPW